jgi:hypothetical protein
MNELTLKSLTRNSLEQRSRPEAVLTDANWHLAEVDEVLKSLRVAPAAGITDAEADVRRREQ